ELVVEVVEVIFILVVIFVVVVLIVIVIVIEVVVVEVIILVVEFDVLVVDIVVVDRLVVEVVIVASLGVPQRRQIRRLEHGRHCSVLRAGEEVSGRGPAGLIYNRNRPDENGSPRQPEMRSRLASRESRLRSDPLRNRFRSRIVCGVTSISSSSSIYSRAASRVNSRGGSSWMFS